MEPINITRRNLFGIRLNHDQLKQDLNDLCREQLDSQKQRWNFDFETLKPINQEQQRFEWNAQSAKPIHYNKVEICLATFDSEDEYERHEEDDECLAMPAFYQLQRIQKMKQTEFNLKKFMQLASVQQQQNEPLKKQSKKKVRNTKKRSSNSKLIITFSENRKDTLRSSKLASNSENKLKQSTILNSFPRKKKNVDSSNASNSNKKN